MSAPSETSSSPFEQLHRAGTLEPFVVRFATPHEG